jgi:hypothetical protein
MAALEEAAPISPSPAVSGTPPVPAAGVVPQEAASPAIGVPAAPAPAAEAPPTASAAPAEPALKPHTEEPSLLAQALSEHDAKAKPKDGEKPADFKPAEPKTEDAPKADAKPEDKKAEGEKPADLKPAEAAAPVEYKYTLPETIKMDDALKGEVHAAFDEFRTNPAEGAQKLIDLHAKAMQTYADDLAVKQSQSQHDTFKSMRQEWGKEILADPQMGGSGYQTTKAAVARMRDALVRPEFLAPRTYDDGSPRPSKFQEMLETTGVGDHVVFWDILHNAARFMDEPVMPPAGIKPAPNNGRPPTTRLRDLYTPRQT